MEKIRHGMFETNSSSTHSSIIASQEEYENWENGKAIMDLFNEKMITLSNNKEIKNIENGYIYHDKDYWIPKGLELKDDMVNLYNKKMKSIEKDIWDLVDNLEYYSKIRGTMRDLKILGTITKRQAIRLYQFIMGESHDTIKKSEIDDRYNKIKSILFK